MSAKYERNNKDKMKELEKSPVDSKLCRWMFDKE